MSLTLSTDIWKNSPHRGSELLVLLALADATQDKNGDGWVPMGVHHLAERTRLSVRSVQVILSALSKAGSIVISPMSGRAGVNRFQVLSPPQGMRPKTARPLSYRQSMARGCRKVVQPVASTLQRAAPYGVQPAAPLFDTESEGVQSVAPGGCNQLHQGDATGCTMGVQRAAHSGATGCTQDELRTGLNGNYYGATSPDGVEMLPPVPPVGGIPDDIEQAEEFSDGAEYPKPLKNDPESQMKALEILFNIETTNTQKNTE